MRDTAHATLRHQRMAPSVRVRHWQYALRVSTHDMHHKRPPSCWRCLAGRTKGRQCQACRLNCAPHADLFTRLSAARYPFGITDANDATLRHLVNVSAARMGRAPALTEGDQ